MPRRKKEETPETKEENPEVEETEVDERVLATKFECVKFVKQLHTENLEYQWQTKKVYPEDLSVNKIIEDAEILFQYLIS